MGSIDSFPNYLAVIREGLRPGASKSSRMVVLGAAMAGLVAAYELMRAGHDPLILEARHRVGGRVETLRTPFTTGLYAEAGARKIVLRIFLGMGIPRVHALALAYVERSKLGTAPFRPHSPHAYHFLHGRRYRIAETEPAPALLGASSHSGDATSVIDMWQQALQPIANKLRQQGEEAWLDVVRQYDDCSLRGFLRRIVLRIFLAANNNWSEAAIEMFGLMFNQEAVMHTSALELIREELGLYYSDTVAIVGGMDRLPRSFLPPLQGRIRFGANVVAITQTAEGVTASYEALGRRAEVSADFAIVTIPLPALRRIDANCSFSAARKRAVRELHFCTATKVFLQCRRRFWEEDDGIFGGSTLTDLPIRKIFYPEHGHEMGRGVLRKTVLRVFLGLAGYAWAGDAQSWGSLPESRRVLLALENVARIHPQVVDEFECGATKVWHDDELAAGSFVLFNPGQQTLLHDDIVRPDGRIHFAGEHTSLTHGWIEGAVSSGLRAANEIHRASVAG